VDAYPCPGCGTPANLTDGCTTCGRPPDPVAAELIALAGMVVELNEEVEQARRAYHAAMDRRRVLIDRYNLLVSEMHGRWTTTGPVPVTPEREPATPVTAARPESSGRTVQNVLFVLGGLLLGSAAIVFTAVAWANFGVLGRAAILGVVTVLALAVPPLALRRRLTGTAETFAALGLLLVLLDGYAAWTVNLADVAGSLPPARYAAVVFAIAGAVAVGYRWATRLAGPGHAAVALWQPVPLLAWTGTGLGWAGWSAVLGALALADVVVLRSARPAVVRVLAATFGGLAAAGALGGALAGLVGTEPAGALRSGAALVLVAAVPLAAGIRGRTWLRELGGAGLVWAVAVAAARVFALLWPDRWLAPVAAVLVALSVGVRLLPVPVRTGPRIGALSATGFVALVPVLLTIDTAGRTVSRVRLGDLGATAAGVTWWVPVALALSAVAVALLVPRGARAGVLAAGVAVVALALPGAVPLPWWGPSIVDGAVLVPLALRTARARRPIGYGLPVPLLAAHAVGVGLGRPGVAALVFAALLTLAAGVALLAREQPVVRTVAAGTALATPAALGAALASYAALPPLPYAVGGLVASTLAVLALASRHPGYAVPGAVAVPLAGLGVVWGCLATRDGWYLAVPVLCDVLVGAAVLPGPGGRPRYGYLPGLVVGGALAALVPFVYALPAVYALLAAPYRWLGAIWTGAPAGLGLVPPGSAALPASGPVAGFGPVSVCLAVIAVAVVSVAVIPSTVVPAALTAGPGRRHLRVALPWTAVPAALALLSGTAAVGAPWPTVPALTVLVGVATALAVALRPAPWLGLLAVGATGAGLAGALPTRLTTLGALTLAVVTSVVCGLTGRLPGIRIAGWVAAVASGGLLAFASARTLDVSVHLSAYWVLGVAVFTLVLSGWFRSSVGTAEWRVVEAAGYGAAAAALLLTSGAGRHTALVLALWGLALGLRALWPGEPVPARRARVVAGTVAELVAYWILLGLGGVTVVEAYTVPAAAVALFAGWLAARTRPGLHSWTAYGPALVAGFAPSLALVLTVPGEPLRRLTLGLVALAAVVAGSVRRRQAPIVVGGVSLVILAGHEVFLLWDLIPRWIPLATAGLVLVGLAVTYERRRRDVTRLREAIGRMG
jgi:hypothetical protein